MNETNTTQEHYVILNQKNQENNNQYQQQQQHHHYHHQTHLNNNHHHHHQQQHHHLHREETHEDENNFRCSPSVMLNNSTTINNNQDDNDDDHKKHAVLASDSSHHTSARSLTVSHLESHQNNLNLIEMTTKLSGSTNNTTVSGLSDNAVGSQILPNGAQSSHQVTLAPLQTPQENASQQRQHHNQDLKNSSALDQLVAQATRLSPESNLQDFSPPPPPTEANQSTGSSSSSSSSSSNSNSNSNGSSISDNNNNNNNNSKQNSNISSNNSNIAQSTDDKTGNTQTTMAIERRYRPQKFCAVCGDKAIACNFNAVTCESCKAFFRRNAFKDQRLKCLFDNRCVIDRVTRRFCSKCRLLKCLQIGMKREWILTDEQKQIKKVKIMQNKQSRQQQQIVSSNKNLGSSSSPSLTPSQDSSSSICSPNKQSSNTKGADSLNCNGGSGTSVRLHQNLTEGDIFVQQQQQQQSDTNVTFSLSARIHSEELRGGGTNRLRRNSNQSRVVETKDATTSCPDEFDLLPPSQPGDRSQLLQNQQQVHYCSLASQCQYCSLRLTGCSSLPVNPIITINQQQQQQLIGDYQHQQHDQHNPGHHNHHHHHNQLQHNQSQAPLVGQQMQHQQQQLPVLDQMPHQALAYGQQACASSHLAQSQDTNLLAIKSTLVYNNRGGGADETQLNQTGTQLHHIPQTNIIELSQQPVGHWQQTADIVDQ